MKRYNNKVYTLLQSGSKVIKLPCTIFDAIGNLQFSVAYLSYDVASGSEITPCNKIDKPIVVYRFTGHVMTSRTTCVHDDKIITFYARNEISKCLSYDK